MGSAALQNSPAPIIANPDTPSNQRGIILFCSCAAEVGLAGLRKNGPLNRSICLTASKQKGRQCPVIHCGRLGGCTIRPKTKPPCIVVSRRCFLPAKQARWDQHGVLKASYPNPERCRVSRQGTIRNSFQKVEGTKMPAFVSTAVPPSIFLNPRRDESHCFYRLSS